MKLLFQLVIKDYRRNRITTLTLSLFLLLSALLMAGGLRVTGTIITSLRGLNKAATPPDYFQMHIGNYDEMQVKQFADSHSYIKDALTVSMLNIENKDIMYQGETLEKCLMDNGFVVQNERFDLLLNMENVPASVGEGEVGIPVYYAQKYNMKVGDQLTLCKGDYNKSLVISTIIRDSSMNSGLTYSKRFLVNEADLQELSTNMGEWEYIFEYLLEDGESTARLQKDYLEEGMPSNGVSVTGKMLTMLNALSFGLVAMMIIAISGLLIMIAMLSLSYIIRATMADESKSIGEMKAIEFSLKSIGRLYEIKYLLLVLIAAVAGFLFSIPFGNSVSASVIWYCGDGKPEWIKWILPIIGLIFFGIYVLFRCHRIIYQNMKSSTVQLMRGEEAIKTEGHYSLRKFDGRYQNLIVAFGELRCKWKDYLLVFFVFVLSSFLILLPLNMSHTIDNPSFISYMGVGKCDIRIHIQYCANIEQQKDTLITYLNQTTGIDQYTIFQNGSVLCENSNGEWEYIRVTNGDETVFPLDYLEGNAPAVANEIALSFLNSQDLGKGIGDSIKVKHRGSESCYTVSGIYQDITYGGKTTKAQIDFSQDEVEGYTAFLKIEEGIPIEEKTEELRNIPVECKVIPVDEFVTQTLGGVTESMKVVEWAAIIISLTLITFITAMFMQLLTAREHSAIAIKKAIGFTNQDIRKQFGIRIIVIQTLAIITGTILANYLGEILFGMILSSVGVAKITMLIEPVVSYLLCPAVQISAVLLMVAAGTRIVRNYHIRDQIME